MKSEYSKFLEKVAIDHGMDLTRKVAFGNPLENSMFNNVIDGALKGLEMVAIGTLDFKLTGIVKLLQSWVKDKREELARTKHETQYGHGSYNPSSGYQVDSNPYGSGSYY